ncbi:DinB family protein [Paenibacillus sp. FSL F4-0087]|jgi:hypothetical protein|uniref:DinB family protein n=1 Tax=unclassified Paenibacillus TaxID=185978 RepID=UPI00096D1CEB|nr:DinB family protein [Paenibacillus sp. LK1]OME85745.1 hypothetical protein BK122_02415 [Paenibacillus pabuli]PIH58193.1 DinB family protein [Paenibacillus sp. LK1]
MKESGAGVLTESVSRLNVLLQSVPQEFLAMNPDEIVPPRMEGKWSRLQILGHLCDSALHNVSRFVQMQHQTEPFSITSYQQEQWVESQQYKSAPIEDVLNLWISLNQSVIRVLSVSVEMGQSQTCILSDGSVVTLEWLAQDYVEHLEHHLQQIFGEHEDLGTA